MTRQRLHEHIPAKVLRMQPGQDLDFWTRRAAVLSAFPVAMPCQGQAEAVPSQLLPPGASRVRICIILRKRDIVRPAMCSVLILIVGSGPTILPGLAKGGAWIEHLSVAHERKHTYTDQHTHTVKVELTV